MIRILVVEDNKVIRDILSDMMIMQDDFDVVGKAENGLAALELLEQGLEVDIVLTDLNMPDMDGIQLTESLVALYDNLKVIVLTMHAKAVYLNRALDAGVSGYLLKDGEMDALYEAIRRVYSGDSVINRHDK